jgi:hypothetical protein
MADLSSHINISANNITAIGNLSATNITGDGSQLTSLPAPTVTPDISSNGDMSIMTYDGVIRSVNYATVEPSSGNIKGNNISATGNISGGNISATGNISGANIIGTYANGNSNVNIATANGNVTISSAGNTTMTITGTGAIITGIAKPTGTSVTGVNSVLAGPTFTPLANTMGGFVSNVNSYTQLTIQNKNTGTDATADFIATADNGSDTVNYADFGIINSGYDANTPTNSLGNIVFAADTYMYAQGNTGNASQSGGNLAIGTTVPGKNVKIFAGGVNNSSIIANIANTGVTVTGNVTVSGGSFVGNGAGLTNVTVNAAGNIQGTSSNVSLVAGSYNWTFNNTGNLTLPGNTFSVNYANNTPVNPVTRFESSWTVPVGNSTQSFTVTASETYYMWVDCNIPNGILTWNATATITNTNVPVVGAQYAWVYNGGGTPIDFTSIPGQFIGTANTIVRSNVAPSATTNRFDFGLNNTSGGNVTVRYGWISIS